MNPNLDRISRLPTTTANVTTIHSLSIYENEGNNIVLTFFNPLHLLLNRDESHPHNL